MITFIDEKGTEHSALVAYSATNAVNGELSVKGTIYTNDEVLHGIDRGWRFRLDDEYYRVTYAKPNDAGRQIEVEFDAVHQFFYDMSKSMVYDTLNGSKPFETYLQAIFSGSGYTYNLETTVGSIRKENFGNKSRLSLFNDIIKAAGLEFSVRGHVVRILKRIGTDLSAIVRKNFNMNELKIEKNINSFVTYQRGLGAWKDDEDHSQGRYESEYESPLAKIYGRIEAEPVVDERYKETGKLLERLKENVDKSYKVSVEIDMEDLSRAGYRLSRPNPGDYIMAINETLGFSQKVRIVSFTSEYDVGGNLISRKVVCNDIGSVQRRASEMSSLARSVQDVATENAKAIATATKALVSADGKNTIYFGESKPRDEPVGTLRKGDQLYLKEGEKTNLYFWNGAEWELNPLEMDLVKFRKEYESKTKEINQSMATQTQQTTQALRTAGANASAIEAAKGAITKLNQDLTGAKQTNQAAIDRLKSDFASAQKAANDQTTLLRSDLANIRTKQSQAESEIAKQVAALNATKVELAGVKSAQANYEQSTTRRLAELSNLADGKASKSELVQTAQELSSRIASVQVGGRNYIRGTRRMALASGLWASGTFRPSGAGIAKTIDVPDSPATGFDKAIRLTSSNARDQIGIAQDGLVLVQGTYTMSCWVKGKRGQRVKLQTYWQVNDNSGVSPIFTLTDENWTKLSFTSTRDRAGAVSIGYVYLVNAEAGEYLDVLAPQLEDGNIGTTPKEAPEDTDGQISAVESSFKQRADSIEASVSSLADGLKTKADSSALTVLSDSIKQSVKSLETDTQNKLDSKLSTAEFDVRASGIRQEIVNATKDKADKALVTAEAGRLREELASLQVGENLFINSEFKNLRDNNQRYTANGRTYQNMIAPYWYNPYNAGLPNAQNIQHGYFDTETFSDTVFAFNESDGSRHWKALSTDFKIGVITAGEYYFSADLYATDLGTHIKFGFYYHNSTGKLNFYAGQTKIEVTEKGRWVRLGAPLKVNDDIDLTKKVQFYVYGYNFTSNSILYLKKPKVSKGRLKSDWSPALEDTEGLITEAKATFERTAQGLRTDLSAVQAYVNADGTRSEVLRSFSREETARQLTAERKAIEAGYVAKAQHTEDVRGLTRRFEELSEGGVNLLRNSAALLVGGDWRTGKWQATSGGNGTAQVVPVTSPPNPLIKSMIRIVNNTVGNKDLSQSAMAIVVGQKYTVSCYARVTSDSPSPTVGLLIRSWANNNDTNRKLHKTISNREWQRYSFTFTADVVANSIQFGQSGAGSVEICAPKIELGAVATSWSPSPEDATSYADTKLAEFRQGIDGQLANVQSALNTANSSLTSFNNWKQSAQETLNKVGKVETGLNETKTSLAEFKRTAEGQLTTINQQVAGKASQTEFQRVQETSKLYERLIGSTEKEIADKVTRMALTNELFQVEVSKNLGLRTVQYQIANAWAVQNLNSNGDIISQINATGPNVRIQGESIHLDGKALIDNGVIKNAMIESMLADKITAGTLDAANVNIINLNANKIVGLDANFIKSKIELAFIEWMRGKTISAQNDAMQINLNDGHVLFYNDDASIKRVLEGYPTQFIRYENKVENGQNHGRTIIGSNRNGTNAWKSASFAGLVIDNNSNNSVDKIYQFGDYNHMRHAQGDDGWNFSVVTQAMTPGVWNKNSEIWARHFVVPRNTKGDTDSPTQFIRLEESVAAIWNILNHAASGQVTMTQAMKNLINSRKAAWDIVRNVG